MFGERRREREREMIGFFNGLDKQGRKLYFRHRPVTVSYFSGYLWFMLHHLFTRASGARVLSTPLLWPHVQSRPVPTIQNQNRQTIINKGYESKSSSF